MNQNSRIERTYSLAQFNNIKIANEFTDIPESLFNNKNFMDRINLLQLVQIERRYRDYLKLYESMKRMGIEESIEYLENLEIENIKTLKEIFEE